MNNHNVVLFNKENVQAQDFTGEIVASSVRSVPNTLMHRGQAGEVYSHAFFYSSDENLKDNIQPLETTVVDQLNPVTFTWKESGRQDCGFIAQEIQKLIPEAVMEDAEGVKSVSITPVVAHLVREIQLLKQKIADLEK